MITSSWGNHFISLNGHDEAGYKILEPSEGHMHCDVIVSAEMMYQTWNQSDMKWFSFPVCLLRKKNFLNNCRKQHKTIKKLYRSKRKKQKKQQPHEFVVSSWLLAGNRKGIMLKRNHQLMINHHTMIQLASFSKVFFFKYQWRI